MVVGIIGGSGLYQLGEGIEAEPVHLQTPFGQPSGPFYCSRVGDHTAVFLARHGEGHRLTPSEINYRANIYGLKKLGARSVVSISAVGSMKKEIAPGDFVLPGQYIDVTKGQRPNTFFGGGVVAHAHFADPACGTLRSVLHSLGRKMGVKMHDGGTYVCIEGPQFSTRAESHLYRAWGVDVIGMTALPEARLAREAGMCYQTVAMSTDYDCWNAEAGDVSVEAILKVLHANVQTSRRLVFELLNSSLPACEHGCASAMKTAVVTPREMWPADRKETLDLVLS